MGAQGFEFGTEQERVPGPAIIQRLNAEPVTYDVQFSFLAVP
jgi:hypothetical protein